MRAAARLGDADGVRRLLAALRARLADADLPVDDDTEQLAATLLRQLTDPDIGEDRR